MNEANCGTCKHWRERTPETYAHCVKVNRRPGWGDIEFMPVQADEVCFRHEAKDGEIEE